MNLSTRARATILSATIAVVFFVLQGVNFVELLKLDLPFDVVKLFIVAAIMYLGAFWVMSFRVKGERYITVLLFPTLAIFILTLYIELIISSIFGDVGRIATQLFASFVVALTSYILVLTANILNVSYLDNIPLGQAGRAAHYVLTLISSYLFFSITFSNSLLVPAKLLAVFLLALVFAYIALWTIDIRFNQRLLSALSIAFLIGIFAFVLLLWPIRSEFVSLILSLVFYMTLGLALEIREVLNKQLWIEYGVIYGVIIFILFLMSNWGINGSLI